MTIELLNREALKPSVQEHIPRPAATEAQLQLLSWAVPLAILLAWEVASQPADRCIQRKRSQRVTRAGPALAQYQGHLGA